MTRIKAITRKKHDLRIGKGQLWSRAVELCRAKLNANIAGDLNAKGSIEQFTKRTFIRKHLHKFTGDLND